METHQFIFMIPSTAGAVSDTRKRIAEKLRHWGLRPGLRPGSDELGSIELATSELVTNAVQHAGPDPISVGVQLRDGLVRIEVWDASRELPRLSLPDTVDESGRGQGGSLRSPRAARPPAGPALLSPPRSSPTAVRAAHTAISHLMSEKGYIVAGAVDSTALGSHFGASL